MKNLPIEQRQQIFEMIDMVIAAAIDSGKPLRFMVAALLLMKLNPQSKVAFSRTMVTLAHQELEHIQANAN